jgi:lambda repressor-like predicted transcriptional regulator
MNRELAKAMQARGWVTRQLAEQSTVSYATCWRALHSHGRQLPRTQLLLATALGYPVAELFPI